MKRVSRRTALRGLGGAAVALPLLECMMPTTDARAQTPPSRLLITFGGFSLVNDSAGASSQGLVPDTVGADYDLKAGTAPLSGHTAADGSPVKDEITIVSGLSIPQATQSNTPPGSIAFGDSFHFHCNPLITGNAQLDTFDSTVTGMSADQIVADQIGNDTTFKSLTYRAQASFYNAAGGIENVVPRTTLSFGSGGQPIVAQVSPKQAYDSLFTGFTPTDPADAAAAQLEPEKRKSILDLVDRNMSALLPKLSQWDRERMERHFDEIRELEKLLEATPPSQTGACTLLPDPGADPPIGGDFNSPGGWNTNDGYSNEDHRARVLARLMHMAFVCDRTRVGTLMFTMFQSFMNAFPLVNAQYNCHELNHQGSMQPLNNLVAWHMDLFGELVALLRDTPEAGGSVLDRCAVVFIVEGGSIGNQGSHATDGMVCLLAGGAGGLVRGEHLVAQGAHPANVLISAMNAVGVQQNQLGQITGNIPALFS